MALLLRHNADERSAIFMLLKDAAKEFEFNCRCRKLSDKTIKNYSKLIAYLLNYLKENYKIMLLEDVKPVYIKAYLVSLQERGLKPQYINDQLKTFKVLFRYLYEEGYTDKILTERIKNVKQPKTIIKTFTEREVKAMIAYYNGHTFMQVRNKLMLMVFFDTGVRVNELITMRMSQIKDDYIIICGKGEKERVVPKSPLLGKWLFKYMNVRESFFEYRHIPDNVFLSRNGKVLTTEAIHRVLKIAAKEVGVSEDVRVSPHTCRHTFAQMQLKNGLDLYSLSRLMGHSNISITQRYLQGIQDDEALNACKTTGILMNL